jgi:hypothetical protein
MKIQSEIYRQEAVGLQSPFVHGRALNIDVSPMSSAREASHSHSHGHAPHGSSKDPAFMAEKLLQLKNSDPQLFNEAWKKIPQTTQENILAYLRKHGGEEQVSTVPHASFEDKNSHTKHKSPDHGDLEHLDNRHEKSLSHSPVLETRKIAQGPIRPLYEWTDGELLAHTLLDSEIKDSSSEPGNTDTELGLELRKISKQNAVQIVQNELIRRLLQTIAGKA